MWCVCCLRERHTAGAPASLRYVKGCLHHQAGVEIWPAAVAGPPESRAGRVSEGQCPCDNLRPRQAHASGCKHCDNLVRALLCCQESLRESQVASPEKVFGACDGLTDNTTQDPWQSRDNIGGLLRSFAPSLD